MSFSRSVSYLCSSNVIQSALNISLSFTFNWLGSDEFNRCNLKYSRVCYIATHREWRKITRNYHLCGEDNVTLLVTRFFAVPLRSACVTILDFSIFFPQFAGSARLYSATRTTMNTRCGTWIHLVFAWRRSSPLINFWEPALGRYVCTATPTPITDMETTFRSTDQHHDVRPTPGHGKSYAVLWIVMRNRDETLTLEVDWITVRYHQNLQFTLSSTQHCYWRRRSNNKYC